MKKIYFFLAALATMTMFSCIDDDSTYADGSINIELGGLEKNYDVVSFSDAVLHLAPTVVTSFPEEDMEYIWCYYDVKKASGNNLYNDTIKCDTISYERNLDYTFNVIDGTYRLLFSARSKSTGYTQTIGTDIVSASSLSRGFCVLKEDADGNTDYDLYSTTYNALTHDVLKAYQGKALSGKPRCMDVVYQMAYINDENDEQDGANMLCITTEDNDYKVIRALDCKTIFTADNIHYEQVQNEIPYRIVRGDMTEFFFTSNGVYNCYSYDCMPGSGVLGAYNGNGGSVHVVNNPSEFNTMVYWNEQTRSIEMVDYNGGVYPTQSTVEGFETTNTDLDCLACGLCRISGELVYFLMQERSNPAKKYIYYMTVGMFDSSLTDVRELDADAPFANAEFYAVNGQTATVAYYLKDNKVYTYNLVDASDPDKLLKFEGLPSDEKISYVSNRYYSGDSKFDYLIIGTQTGDTYKVYMYNMIAGEPVGAPEVKFSGTGKLNRIVYIDPAATDYTLPLLDQ